VFQEKGAPPHRRKLKPKRMNFPAASYEVSESVLIYLKQYVQKMSRCRILLFIPSFTSLGLDIPKLLVVEQLGIKCFPAGGLGG